MLKYCFKAASLSEESITSDYDGDPLYRIFNASFIRESYAFWLSGTIPENGDWMIIDFNMNNNNKDIALRLEFRCSKNSLVRTSRVKRNWNLRETALENQFRLVKTKEFDIEIFFADDYIYIAVDGIHVAKYTHRINNFTDINTIEIRGDVIDVLYHHSFISSYPSKIANTPHISRLRGFYAESANIEDIESNDENRELMDETEQFLPMPYYATFSPRFLRQNYSIIVKGRVSAKPNKIIVALQAGLSVWPTPITPIQLEFRFRRKRDNRPEDPVLTLNAFQASKRSDKFVSSVPNSLRPGADFNLRIVRGRMSFGIFMNDKLIHDIIYFINPRLVDTCRIQGDIQLMEVFIESD